jgi:hypothetical protein
LKQIVYIFLFLVALSLGVSHAYSRLIEKKRCLQIGLQLNPENDFNSSSATTFSGLTQPTVLHEEISQTTNHAINYNNLLEEVNYLNAKQRYIYLKPILYKAIFLLIRSLRL